MGRLHDARGDDDDGGDDDAMELTLSERSHSTAGETWSEGAGGGGGGGGLSARQRSYSTPLYSEASGRVLAAAGGAEEVGELSVRARGLVAAAQAQHELCVLLCSSEAGVLFGGRSD
jgi:hypothetical protein